MALGRGIKVWVSGRCGLGAWRGLGLRKWLGNGRSAVRGETSGLEGRRANFGVFFEENGVLAY